MADGKNKKPDKKTDSENGTGNGSDIPENGLDDGKNGATEKSGRQGVVATLLPAALSQAIRVAIMLCLGLLVLGVGIGAVVVFTSPDPQGEAQEEPVRSAEEIAREKEELIKEAEKTATWRNAHCKMMHAYYQGPEPDLPQAELVGLPAGADDDAVQERCAELLDAVRLLGGWPTAKPQQDNFVVCTGFRFELTGTFAFSVRVTPESLAAGTILYGRPGNEIHSQEVSTDTGIGIGTYTPVIVRADDSCVVVGVKRLGRRRAIPGRILRDEVVGE